MKLFKRLACAAVSAALAISMSGCVMTVDQMYRLPKHSDSYNNLQSAIDEAMQDLSYSAPLSGENQQNVQLADLDGDGEDEYILFAKSSEEKPLRILVFRISQEQCRLVTTVACNGSAFDVVEYANMDSRPGLEIVVGRRLSDQLVRSVSVYTLQDNDVIQILFSFRGKFACNQSTKYHQYYDSRDNCCMKYYFKHFM